MLEVWHRFVGYFSDGLSSIANAFAFLGGHKWAAAIIAVTVIIRTLLLPLAIRQIRSMRETQRLQPEIARIRQKFKDDRQKQQQEMMALYQREGVNPFATCLPMIAQMPIIIAFYQALRKLTSLPPDLAQRVKLHKLDPTKALEIAQHRVHGVPRMPFLGLGDLAHPSNATIAGWLLIVLMTGVQFLSTRQLNPGQTDQQRRMQMLMPLMFVFIFIRFPAALVLYWTTQSIYQFVQQLVMTRGTRAPGWRGLLGLESQDKVKAIARADKKPQVRPTAVAPAPTPAVALAGSGKPAFDALAARRSLEEKRQRRRRKKKKRKR